MTKIPQMPKVTLVGCGSLGTSLASSLHGAGIRIDEIIVRSKNPRPKNAHSKNARLKNLSKRVAGSLGARLRTLSDAELYAQVIWICTPDDVIEDVAKEISSRLSAKQVLLHSSGALNSDILRYGKAAVASAHPMMSFTRGKAISLHGVAFALEGDLKATRMAAKLVARCGGEFFGISSTHKTLYHVFASACSPLLTALLLAGEEIGKAAHIAPGKLRKLSKPIVTRTLENYFAHGAAEALSGPLRRGDVATIRRHLDALALTKTPEIRAIYVALSRLAVKKLPVKNKRELEKALAI